MNSDTQIGNFESELNFIFEDIEKEFVKVAKKGFVIPKSIEGILEDEIVEIVEILSSAEYNENDPSQFVEVYVVKKSASLKGVASERIKEYVNLDFKEKAKIIDQYLSNEN